MSWRAEINAKTLDGYSWQTNRLRFATREEAQAHLDALTPLAISSDHDGLRVMENDDAVNTRWDFDARKAVYEPALEGER